MTEVEGTRQMPGLYAVAGDSDFAQRVYYSLQGNEEGLVYIDPYAVQGLPPAMSSLGLSHLYSEGRDPDLPIVTIVDRDSRQRLSERSNPFYSPVLTHVPVLLHQVESDKPEPHTAPDEQVHTIYLAKDRIKDWQPDLREMKISSIEQIIRPILLAGGIPIDTWTKGVRGFAEELLDRDSRLVLEEDRMYRCISVATMQVVCFRNGDPYKLFETEQRYPHGKVVKRELHADEVGGIGGKMKRRESIVHSMQRELNEELNFKERGLDEIRLDQISLPKDLTRQFIIEFRNSQSLRGLLTQYTYCLGMVELQGNQIQDSYEEISKDKTTIFRWRKISPEFYARLANQFGRN